MFFDGLCAFAVSLAFLSSPIASLAGSSPQTSANSATPAAAQKRPQRPEPPPAPTTRADILRGAYGPYRANNDLLSYHLDIRVDPEKQMVSGKNTIRFRMLADGHRIQLDLNDALKIDKILLGTTILKIRARFRRGLREFSRDAETRAGILD